MSARARFVSSLVAVALLTAPPQKLPGLQSAEAQLQAAIYKQQVEGDVRGAIVMLGRIATESADDRAVAAQALLQLGLAHETLGSEDAAEAYRRLVRDYPDQEDAAGQARERLARLIPPVTGAADRPEGLNTRLLWVDRASWIVPGAISPDGRELAVVDWGVTDEWRRDNSGDLVVVEPETGDYRIVGKTGSAGEDGDTYALRGVWSRDGERIAYSVWPSEWNRQVLRVVDADGSNDRVVSDNVQHAELRPAAWSANGSFIVALVVGWDGVLRIVTISTDGGAVTTLKSLGQTLPGGAGIHEMSLSLSPDDRFLAYAYRPTPGQQTEIHVLAMDGSDEQVIAPSEVAEASPHWSPDGRRLVFLSDRSGNTGLWAVDMEEGRATGEPELIRPHTGPLVILGFTAEGALAYKSSVPETHLRLRAVDWDRGRFVGEGEPLTSRFVGYNLNPTWSPDGRKVAFISRRPGPELDGSNVLVVRSLDGDTEREIELEVGLSGETRPAWSKDGRTILLQAYRIETTAAGSGRRRAAYRIDIETGDIVEEPYIRDYAGFWWTEKARFVTERQSEGLRSLGVRISGQRDLGSYLEDDLLLRPGERLLSVTQGIRWVRAIGCEQAASYPKAVCDGQRNILIESVTQERTTGELFMSWELSPDGTTLAYILADPHGAETRSLWVWPISGDRGPQKLVGNLPSIAAVVRWMPNGRRLLYHVGAPAAEASEIYRIDATGGEPEALEISMSRRQFGDLEFQPGGDRVVLSVNRVPGKQGRAEVWLLSGFQWDEE